MKKIEITTGTTEEEKIEKTFTIFKTLFVPSNTDYYLCYEDESNPKTFSKIEELIVYLVNNIKL